MTKSQTRYKSTHPCRPFIKWVGGKRSILPELIKRLPTQYKGYHEPFVGGGALFFAVQPSNAYLSDINANLITTYNVVRDNVEDLIKQLKVHERLHNNKYYREAREQFDIEKDPVKLAALFIYLNKTCFNGLYRVNRKGLFNVPMGRYNAPDIANEDILGCCSTSLINSSIKVKPFNKISIIKNHFYYLDPPYHQTYNSYSANKFGEKEQLEVALLCRKIDKKGGYFMLSNSETPFIKGLYKEFTIEPVFAARTISCRKNQRLRKIELIIRNYS